MHASGDGKLWSGLDAALKRCGRVDQVELKVLLDASLEEAMVLLGARVRSPLLRSIYYLDTPDLLLNRDGVIARVRITEVLGQGRSRADAVVKLCRKVRRSKGFPVELDALPHAVRPSATAGRRVPVDRARRALRRDDPVRHLFSRVQKDLLFSVGVPVEDMVVVGRAEAVRLVSADARRCVAIESWRRANAGRVTELSMKCRPGSSRAMARAMRELVAGHGLRISPVQSTKTQLVLQQLVGDAAHGGRCA